MLAMWILFDGIRSRQMGMTIDEAALYMELYKRKLFNSVSDLDKDIEAYDIAIDTMRKYQQLQADYENRLKADLVAMLAEIQLEIEEVKTQSGFDEAWDGAVKQCSEIIQQKINSLKEAKDGENNN